MMKMALSYFPLKVLPLIAFIIFMTIFAGVIIWVFRPNAKKVYDQISRIPLDENTSSERSL